MQSFLLSPGITPLLADLFVSEVPVAIGLGLVLARSRGVLLAVALNAWAMGAIKLVTDWQDLPDAVVAVGAVLAGGVLVVAAARPEWLGRVHSAGWIAGGLLLIGLGAFKIRFDFYDPFDVLLADLEVIGGLVALAHGIAARRSGRRTAPPYAVAT
ncbi:MAG TPA: hypothetical protein VFF67_00725 [Thermoplasmata archaeon]|nr:hypothetical protein [Thermoplasmata archaeon]